MPTAALPVLGELCDELGEARPASLAKLTPLLEGFEQLPAATLPEGLTATLRHYQKQGVDWLCFLRDAGLGAVLADDMGLGKTLQTLARDERSRAGGVSEERGPQLGRGDRAISSRALGRRLPWPEAQARRDRRRHAHHLRDAAARRRAPRRGVVGHGRARRGAGHQERGESGGPRRLRAPRRLPRRALGDAGREPARRALEPVSLHQPRARSARARTSRTATRCPSGPGAPTPPRGCADASDPSPPADEARGRAASCLRAPTSSFTASSRKRSATSTTPSARPPRKRCSPSSPAAGTCSPRSRRSSGCVKRPATRRSFPASKPRPRRR